MIILQPKYPVDENDNLLIKEFDPKRYWETRLANNADLSTVGHRSLGFCYNQYIYRRRLEVLTRYIALLGLEPETLRILDIGCGSGFYAEFWRSRGVKDYVGLDISQDSISRLSNTYNDYHFIHADITRPGSVDSSIASFDLITAFDVLYHIVDDTGFANAVHNISNCLRPDGHVLIFDQLARKDYSLMPHVKFRGRNNYEAILRSAGLVIRQSTKLFVVLVPPVFGIRVIDIFVAGIYKSMGLIMKRIDRLGNVIGKSLYFVDQLLLKVGVGLPNNEAFVATKTDDAGGQ